MADLPRVVEGDPHPDAHNDERDVLNKLTSAIDVLPNGEIVINGLIKLQTGPNNGAFLNVFGKGPTADDWNYIATFYSSEDGTSVELDTQDIYAGSVQTQKLKVNDSTSFYSVPTITSTNDVLAIKKDIDISKRFGKSNDRAGAIISWGPVATPEDVGVYAGLGAPGYSYIDQSRFGTPLVAPQVESINVADYLGLDSLALGYGMRVTMAGLYRIEVRLSVRTEAFAAEGVSEPAREFGVYLLHNPAGGTIDQDSEPILEAAFGTGVKDVRPEYGNSVDAPNEYLLKTTSTLALKANAWIGVAGTKFIASTASAPSPISVQFKIRPLVLDEPENP